MRTGRKRPGPEILDSIEEALARARELAESRRESWCVISGRSRRDGRALFAVTPMDGFGLPPGWILEETVPPSSPRTEIEPPEKTSTNGF